MDFDPVTKIAVFPAILVVHPSLPVRSVKELVALAKARPAELNFGSTGNGTPPQLAAVMLNQAAGINMVHVPYRGSGLALTALLGTAKGIEITIWPCCGNTHPGITGIIRLLKMHPFKAADIESVEIVTTHDPSCMLLNVRCITTRISPVDRG